VREAEPDEDDARQGAFMVQTAQPHEHAEDPGGLQRPPDIDQDTPAEELAESLADLPAARQVSTPQRAAEVLHSEDASDDLNRQRYASTRVDGAADGERLVYPEWDHRIPGYRQDGATVRLLRPALGPQQWVDTTLARHRGLRDSIRRRFEMLKAEPMRLRRQLDGEEIDLEAYVDGYADFHAGLALSQAFYQTRRRARRDMAIMLLIDVSGSTDAWISGNRRVIDVEREALLLVCLALQSLAEPYAVHAFSGEGAQAVDVRVVKGFDEPFGDLVARRIAGLEPEYFTRTGAAVRHATAKLMEQPVGHRLLLLLSDGKPNDVDVYEGRYGVQDTRQAVAEARLQGVFPFCLTVDRQASGYLPAIFGARQYGLLPRPELLPAVLLQWMRRLLSA
jgi:nitric oxide reductase NorD protein